MWKIDQTEIQTIQKKQTLEAQRIKKTPTEARCPKAVLVLLHIQLHQPWEEKMGLLMLLLVVMAASSHLE